MVALYASALRSMSDELCKEQISTLQSYAKACDCVVVQEYTDEALSTSDPFLALEELLADGEERFFEAVFVDKLQRLGRSIQHLGEVAGRLSASAVDLVVVELGIDTSKPEGSGLFNVIKAISTFESDLIRERVASGMRAAKRQGRHFGRQRSLTAANISRLERLFRAGRSQREIARELQVGKATVAREIERLGLLRASQ